MHQLHGSPGSERHPALAERFRRVASGCLVAFVVVPAIAFVATWIGMRSGQREARESIGWPTAPGTILESEVLAQAGMRATDERPTKRAGTSHRARVRYSYVAGGAERFGTRIEVFQRYHPTPEEAAAQLAPYPAGAPVTVRYDPEAPERSVLEPGPEEFDNTYFFAFGGGFLVISIALSLVLRGLLRARTGVLGSSPGD